MQNQSANDYSYYQSLDDLKRSLTTDLYRQSCAKWITNKLGEFLWSKQIQICNSVDKNRRTAVYSCHRIGKSFLAGRLAVWWIDTHDPGTAMVVTSSHSAVQVKAAIWREIGRVHARGKFPGRMNQAEWHMTMPNGNEELVAFGRKPADEDHTAFQGIYSKHILILIDEACYIAKPLWDGIDTLASNEFSRVVAFGNPDDINTEFGEVCKPGSGWNSIQIGYADTPNFTGEEVPDKVKEMLIGPTWVAEKLRKWGEDNPFYQSKVLGKFPDVTTDGLFKIQWIKDAQERSLEKGLPIEIGADVGAGGNKSTIACRWGDFVRILKEDQNPNTMETLSNILEEIKVTGADIAKVDNVGIGHGCVDRAEEMSTDQQLKRENPDLVRRANLVKGVNVGEKANDSSEFINIRAEGYWSLRERFQEGKIDIDPNDEDLAAQLLDIKSKRTVGRIQIESKQDMRKRGRESPDRADAVMLAFLEDNSSMVVDLAPGKLRLISR